MANQYETIVRAVNEAFQRNDMQSFLSYCTDDVVWNMIGNATTEGKEAILQMMSASSGECPDISIHLLFSDGDKTACTGTFSMANKEGVKEHYDFCDIYRFEGEKIKAMDSYVVAVKP